MKKVLTVLMVVVLALALSVSAFADYSYDAETGKITGSYEADGWVETYVNGAAAGGDTLSIDAEAGQSYDVEVYVDGELASSQTVVAEAAEEPAETEAPAETETPVATAAPAASNTSSSNKDNVPKTGDNSNIVLWSVLFGVAAMAAVVTVVASKKNAGKE